MGNAMGSNEEKIRRGVGQMPGDDDFPTSLLACLLACLLAVTGSFDGLPDEDPGTEAVINRQRSPLDNCHTSLEIWGISLRAGSILNLYLQSAT